ncbi:MAG TPA: M36 family metallopeptidase [Nocardioidaceae bacterium]|nr:M36 family metallopeptidase [Nocardioidaceae bacterium]
MRLSRSVAAASILATTAALAAAAGQIPTAHAVVEHHGTAGHDEHVAEDSRLGNPLVKPSSARLDAVRQLVDTAGQGARVTWDGRFGTPRTMYPAAGEALSAPRSGSAVEVARAFVAEHRAAFGLSDADVRALEVTRDHRLTGVDVTVVNLTQTVGGVAAVRGGSLGLAVDGDGRVLSLTGSVTPRTDLLGSYSLTPALALTKAGAAVGATNLVPAADGKIAGFDRFETGLASQSFVQKAVFPTADGVRAAYRVLLVKKLDEAYDLVLDAATGTVLYQTSLVHHEAEGIIYPNYPGAPKGGEPEKVSFGPTEESPGGYVDPTGLTGIGVTLLGNNADTFKNWSNFIAPADQANRTVAPTGQFNFGFPDAWGTSECQAVPPSYEQDSDASSTNLFYQHNRIHDEFYSYGFTESAGNFQLDGGDPIMGLVQAGAISGGAPTYTGRDNAYMLTLPDGIPPWSGMFLWEPINDAFEGPCRDGDFDAGVIEHEYAHGLSNRYVGTEDGALGGHQSGSMGEGWGDWYALNHLHKNDLQDDSVVGAYVTGNTERGIRNWPYDDTEANFGDIGYDIVGAEVHSDGEIWTSVLWDLRRDLVDELGQQEAAEVAAFLVTDAMPLAPNDPSMLDMRDAVLKALDIRYHTRSDFDVLQDLVYAAFARNGMGVGASNQKSEADPTGASDIDPVPSFAHQNPEHNGTLTGRVVNAATGEPVADARVMLGTLEAGVSPVATTGSDGRFTVAAAEGRYPLTIQARGFGAQTLAPFDVTAGRTLSRQYSLAPNLASAANGATVVSSTSEGAGALIDDTEQTRWKTAVKSGNAVVELAEPATISRLQVSAFTTSRFEAVRSFTLQTSTDGVSWKTQPVGKDAFDYQEPRPTVDDVHYRTFELPNPVKASYIRVWADEALGDTKTNAQFGDFQVFGSSATAVEPLPPAPLDEPYTETFTIAGSNPGGDSTDGGVVGTEFASTCSTPPASQGTDGWVSELPESFGDGAHKVSASGAGPTYDLDLYFFDADCTLIGSVASSAADESGSLPSGTRYVLTSNWAGAATEVTLTAVDTQ